MQISFVYLASVLLTMANACTDYCSECSSYSLLESCALFLCNQQSARLCSIPYCVKEYPDPKYCMMCTNPFTVYNSVCMFYCQPTNRYVKIPYDCCSSSLCTQCNDKNPDYCTQCKSSLYLYKGSCIDSCPTNTYLKDMECFDCDPNCVTCDGPTQCTSCLVEAHTLPLCLCPSGTIPYDSECLPQCPYLYSESNWICQRICAFGEYPNYQPNSSGSPSFTCSQITSFSDDYCIQNIRQLPYSISFSFSQFEFSQLLVNVFIQDTPYVCYSYSLEGINSFSFIQLSNFNDGSTNSLVYFVNITDIQDPNKVHCTATNCFLKFIIAWNNQTQYTYRISLKVLPKEILMNSASYTKGKTEDIQVFCEDCIIPLDKLLPSVLEIDCQNTIKCTKKSIIVTTDNLITITQKLIYQPAWNQTVLLLPHSLKLTYLDEPTGQQIDTLIRNYNFSNSIANQITYKFYSIAVKQAKLTVTSSVSFVEGQNNNNNTHSEVLSGILNPSRLLQSTASISEKGNYSQDELDLIVIDNSSGIFMNETLSFVSSEQFAWGCLGLLIFGNMICFGVVCFKKMKKTLQIRKNNYSCNLNRSKIINTPALPKEITQSSKATLQTINDDEKSYLNQQQQESNDASEIIDFK